MTGATIPSKNGGEANSLANEGAKQDLLVSVEAFADEIAARPNLGTTDPPLREIARCIDLGLLTAVLPQRFGGLAIGVEPGTQLLLLRLLATLGGADLALARLYEGHINALLLIQAYGSASQVERAAEDARRGLLFGVWNTGNGELLKLYPEENGSFRFDGHKTFATGADFVQRPIVTAEVPGVGAGGGWQMVYVSMDRISPSIDRSFWHPLGMESSGSYGVDLSGCRVAARDLVGAPGDFYVEPLFKGGAVRFAAVHAGAICRLHQKFSEWLHMKNRQSDAYQIARLGETAMLAQEAILWVEKAANVAEENLLQRGFGSIEPMTQCANMMRLSIERIGVQMMQKVTVGVGAHGLLQPHSFERIIRDLTMYLRQPSPDQTLADVGKTALRQASTGTSKSRHHLWSEPQGSLTPDYFKRIYEQAEDPWNFTSSSYEADKYLTTLNSLPKGSFRHGLEVGCSIGVLTARLADRCDALTAVDVSERALELARERCSDKPQVDFQCMRVPQEVPAGPFDLIVVSEVAYYWQIHDLMRAAKAFGKLQPIGGVLVLVHWTPAVADNPLTGDEVHDFWMTRPEWRPTTHLRRDRFRLDVLVRCEPESRPEDRE